MKRGRWIIYLAGLLSLAVLASGCVDRRPTRPEEIPEQTGTKDDAPEETGAEAQVPNETGEDTAAEETGEDETEPDPAGESGMSAPTEDVKEQLTGKTVRVAIHLTTPSVIGAGYKANNITKDPEAQAYQAGLKKEQEEITRRIEAIIGHPLDVVWNFTLSTNVISANVYPSEIEKILTVDGVESVSEEQTYQLHG